MWANCKRIDTEGPECWPGLSSESSSKNFYAMKGSETELLTPVLIKANFACTVIDFLSTSTLRKKAMLGYGHEDFDGTSSDTRTPEGCARLCKMKAGCKYFALRSNGTNCIE
jgi:hypothetical protein